MGYEVYETWGFKIYLDVNESGMMQNRSQEKYEVNKFEWLSENLTKDDTFIDVGCNKGDFTLLAASRCKKVYAVEPHPDNIEWIRKSIELNGFDNIEILDGCAMDKTCDVKLGIGAKSGHHSITVPRNSHMTVSGFRLDDIIKEDNLVVKIDVEGAEKLVLDGMTGIMNKMRACYIDLDSGDFDGVQNRMEGFELIQRVGRDLLFYKKREDD